MENGVTNFSLLLVVDIAGTATMVESVQGSELDVNATDGVTVDGATVVTADIETDNGVIHVIDSVILPKS